MTKYKLKKWYPGHSKELKEGDILIKTDCGYKKDMPSSYFLSAWAINESEVENNPEFWEKVVEKDYEILKVMYTSKYPYYNIGAHPSIIIPLPVIYDKKPDWFKIHSVKRLFDGEVFTVGDKVTYINGKTKTSIKEFIVDFNTLKVKVASQHSPTGYAYYHINHTSKAKEPLFTTEDGVDIYEGDEYYHVSDSLKMYQVTACINDLKPPINRAFSNSEKAEEYIEQHKPRYSKADVKEALAKALGSNSGDLTDVTFKPYKFKDLLDL